MKEATKTVTGKLVSTKPISLSNAEKYISRFVSSDNGASQAVSVYLQRASDAFNGLVQFRKKLKGSHSGRKEQVSQLLELDAKVETLGTADGNPPGKKMKNSQSKEKGKKSQEFKHDIAVSDQVEVRESLEIKGKDKVNPMFAVKYEETTQIEQNSCKVAEKNKKNKPGKEKVQKDGTPMIEHPAGVVSEIGGDKNFESKGKKNRKFDVKNEQSLQIEQTAAGVVEEKKKKKSGIDVKNEETVHVRRGLDGGEKSKQEMAQVEGNSDKTEKKKKRKKGEAAEVKEIYKGIDGKKAGDRIVYGGEAIDLSKQSGKKNVRKSEAFDKTEQDMMENEGDTKGAEGLSLKSRDKKKKKIKESECELEEEGVGGVGVPDNSEEVDVGQPVDLADQSEQKKGSTADGNDEIKQCNVEVKDEGYSVGEGSVEMRSKKKKKKKSEGEDAEKSFRGEEVDSREIVYLAEQMRKNRGTEADGNDNMEVIGELDRVEESTLEIKDQKKRKKTAGQEFENNVWVEERKKMKIRRVHDGETIDLTEQTGKKKKRRKIEVEGK